MSRGAARNRPVAGGRVARGPGGRREPDADDRGPGQPPRRCAPAPADPSEERQQRQCDREQQQADLGHVPVVGLQDRVDHRPPGCVADSRARRVRALQHQRGHGRQRQDDPADPDEAAGPPRPARARRDQDEEDHAADQQCQPDEHTDARDAEQHADRCTALRVGLGRAAADARRRARPDPERVGATDRMRVGGDHVPRDEVHAVGQLRDRDRDGVIGRGRVMRGSGRDPLAGARVDAYRAERDLDVLVERQRQLRRSLGRDSVLGWIGRDQDGMGPRRGGRRDHEDPRERRNDAEPSQAPCSHVRVTIRPPPVPARCSPARGLLRPGAGARPSVVT